MKKIFIAITIIISLLIANQIYYLTSLQFTCTEKIEQGKDLNIYETFSALQTHLNLGLFGWVVEPTVAGMCIIKQFHITPDWLLGAMLSGGKLPKDDSVIKKAKQQLLLGEKYEVRLAWKKYTSQASILYNGSTISIVDHEFGPFYSYDIPVDYKPGIITINGITLSETVFDYLENKNILMVYHDSKNQELTEEEIKLYRLYRK